MYKEFQNPGISSQEATFVWRGEKPPGLIGDFNDWDPQRAVPLERMKSGDWAYTMHLPDDAYVEYAYLLDGKRVPDPGNPNLLFNGIDAYNHFFYMPGGAPTSLTRRTRSLPQGRLQRYKVNAEILVGMRREHTAPPTRRVDLYQPPVAEPCPLLVVFDGPDYLRRGRLPKILDNLIARHAIRPLALAMVANGGNLRGLEYSCNDATVGFILEVVLPLAEKHLNLIDVRRAPGAFGVLGASMGGLISLYTAMRAPHIFGSVLSQAGAFDPHYVVHELVGNGSAKSLNIWMEVGTIDFLLEDNRRMRDLFISQGYNVAYREFNAGHNFTAWRDHIERGLVHLFGI
jgi:enterochelin esterase-like enzyme